jgi:hypothetical protein
MIVCTATFHQGEVRETVTSRPRHTRADAFLGAVRAQDIGLRSNTENTSHAVSLLVRYDDGARPSPGDRYLQSGYASLEDRGDQPVILIGWSTYTFAEVEVKPVRLWQITAQVEVNLPSGYTSSRQVPTFYLDPSVQGILNAEGAVKVAEDILSTAGPVDEPFVVLHVTADPVY